MEANGKAAGVVVGVVPGQSPVVVERAVRIAELVGRPLLFVYADNAEYASGLGEFAPHDLSIEVEDPLLEQAIEGMRTALRNLLCDADVAWDLAVERGTAAEALARAAAREGAEFIVIGGREAGSRALLRELALGSVAQALARIQPVPVVLVPVQGAQAE